MKVLLKNISLGFPAIATPQAFGEGEPAYGAKFPIVPNKEHQKLIEAAIKEVAKDQWKDKADGILELLTEDNKVCFVKKVYKSKKTGEPYAGFEGAHYLSARNAKTQPTVFDKFNQPIEKTGEIERQAFSGANVHASVDIWAQDNKWGRRINCSLLGIMVTGEGERVGGGASVASQDDFADMAEATAAAEDIL